MEQLVEFVSDFSYVVVALIVVLISKLALEISTPFKIDDQLSAADNPAFGLSLVGYYLGVIIVFIAACYGESQEGALLYTELALDFVWAILGVVLLNLSRFVLDLVVFRGFSTRKEIIEDRNCGMGVVEFGTFVSSALVIAGGISGEGSGQWGHTLMTALVFWALGQVALVVFAAVYQRWTRYDLHAELEKDNVAAGVAFAGNLIAMGMLILRGTAGEFISWQQNLAQFGWYLFGALILILIGRTVIDGLFLPRRTLHEEIAEDRNLNAGYLESGLLIGLAAVVVFVV